MSQPPSRAAGPSEHQRALIARMLEQKGIRRDSDGGIPRRPAEGTVPLSFGQERLWFFDQLEPGTPAYNLPDCYRLRGTVDVAALEGALSEIVKRHEVLRTSFRVVDGDPTQVIGPPVIVAVPVEDVGDMGDAALEALVAEEARRPFDLANGPLLRARLFSRHRGDHVLACTMHHAAFDGWSRGVFQRELAELYRGALNGRPPVLVPLPIQYADFAVWQRQRLQGEVVSQQLAYWMDQLGGRLPILELPTDKPRSAALAPNGAETGFTIPAEVADGLREIGREQGVTLFMTLLALFQVLLHRYTRLGDIIVGTPIANRNRGELEHMIGFFVNTIALRTDLSDNPSFRDLVQRVSETTLNAYTHQELPFERLVEELHPERNVDRHPVFQVMFDWQSAPTETLELPGATMTPWRIDPKVARFDLTLSIVESQDALQGWFEYNTNLFEAETIGRMIGHYETLARAAISNPETPIGALQLLTEDERHQVVVAWNDTAGDFRADRCVHEVFEEQAATRADIPAVIAPDGVLTFRELNARANQLARYLQQFGVSAGSLVSMFVEKSLDMVVSLLGILKAGAAYVPLDPRYPPERMTFIFEDTDAPVLLTHEDMLERLPAYPGTTICLDRDWDRIAEESADNLGRTADPTNVLYVIYTSGSTGRPKGVEIQHRAFMNLCASLNDFFSLHEDDRILQLSSIAFDTGSEEILPMLLKGGGVVLLPTELIGSFERFHEFVESNQITVLDLPTAFWHEWVGALEGGAPFPSTVRVVAAGGEAAMPGAFRAWRRIVGTDIEWLNSYGPTETTVTCSLWPAGDEDGDGMPNIPIGVPLLNTQLYVLDPLRQPVPVGVPGELYIGGELVGRGYLNRPELTAERFVPNPFSDVPGARMYKSGDVCRWRPDGNLEFFGRTDHQVKIRGFRIELGEIEAVMGDHPDVRQAATLVYERGGGDKRIVAYFVPQEPGTTVDLAVLREYLREKLPEYMVPAQLVQLDAFPLTTTRKVDRKALPDPGELEWESDVERVVPRTDTERFLAESWQEVLGISEVSVYDNFFEVGGHSLLATRIIARVRRHFEIELELRRIFEAPTIADLATAIEDLLLAEVEALSEEEAERLAAADPSDV